MNNTCVVDRTFSRLSAFRDKPAVSAMLCFWHRDEDDFTGDALPVSFRKYDKQFPTHTFQLCGATHCFLAYHSKDQELKELVLRSLNAAAIDLSAHLEKHGFKNTFDSGEKYWMTSLMGAGLKCLLGAEGIVGNSILRTMKLSDCTIDERLILDDRFNWTPDQFRARRFVELHNIIESSLMFLEHLSSEPRVSTPKKKRGNDTAARLKELWETTEGKAFCLLNPIAVIAERIGRTQGTVSDCVYWKEVILPEKKLVGTNGKHVKRIKKAIEAQERISEQDEQLLKACEELFEIELTEW